MLVFVSPALRPAVSSISSTTVGTGVMGYMGNKGAVGVRLVLHDTLRLVLIDCHLAAFANATDRRNWDAAEVLRRAVFEHVDKEVIGLDESLDAPEGMDKSDVVLWCGDLNYRVELPGDDIRRLLAPFMPKELPPTHDNSVPPSPVIGNHEHPKLPSTPKLPLTPKLPPTPSEIHPDAHLTLEGTIESLLKHDQLFRSRREGKAFVGFKEGKIGFLPSYKYDFGTEGTWDSSEKARAPSWCDRILWRVREQAEREVDIRERSASVSTTKTDEILFETDDPEDEDLVVSRAETPLPHPAADEKRKSLLITHDTPLSMLSTASGDVTLHQLYYISYQTVSKSDHKPVAALFALSFPGVVAEDRARVHAEVAREVDKLENERRPIVTVVIERGDPDEPPEPTTTSETGGEEIVEFGAVRYNEPKQRVVTVANTGTSPAKVHFVTRPDFSTALDPAAVPTAEVIAKPFIGVSFSDSPPLLSSESAPSPASAASLSEGVTLQPGEVCQIHIRLHIVVVADVRALNAGTDTPEDVLVLRVDSGRDVFLPIAATWLPSAYGRSLDELVRVPEGEGGVRAWTLQRLKQKHGRDAEARDAPVLYSAPREVYRLTEFVLDQLRELVEEGVKAAESAKVEAKAEEEVKAKAEPEVKVEAKADAKTEAEGSRKQSSEATKDSEPEPVSKHESKPESESTLKLEPTSKPEPESESKLATTPTPAPPPPPHWATHPGWPFHVASRLPSADPSRRHRLESSIWDSLDTDSAFDATISLASLFAPNTPDNLLRRAEFAEAAAVVLLAFLDGLMDAVVPEALWLDVSADRRAAEALLEKMDNTNKNVFVYLMGWLAEVVTVLQKGVPEEKEKDRKLVAERAVEALAAVVVRRKGGGRGNKAEEARRNGFVRAWVEM